MLRVINSNDIFRETMNGNCVRRQCQPTLKYWKLEKTPAFVPSQRQAGYKMKDMADMPVEQYHQSNVKVVNTTKV